MVVAIQRVWLYKFTQECYTLDCIFVLHMLNFVIAKGSADVV